MHLILFAASVGSSVCSCRTDVDTAWRRRSCWTSLVRWGHACFFVRPSVRPSDRPFVSNSI